MRTTALGLIVLLLAVAAPTRPASAQSDGEAPLATATAFFAALHDARWSDAAAMVDSTSARTTRDFHLGALVA